jgi:hypothetical protein
MLITRGYIEPKVGRYAKIGRSIFPAVLPLNHDPHTQDDSLS